MICSVGILADLRGKMFTKNIVPIYLVSSLTFVGGLIADSQRSKCHVADYNKIFGLGA